MVQVLILQSQVDGLLLLEIQVKEGSSACHLQLLRTWVIYKDIHPLTPKDERYVSFPVNAWGSAPDAGYAEHGYDLIFYITGTSSPLTTGTTTSFAVATRTEIRYLI
jgi:hypothetical protein